jgi:hypothetical protein
VTTFPEFIYETSETPDTLTLPIRGHEYTWTRGHLPLRSALALRAVGRAVETGADTDVALPEDDAVQLLNDLVGEETRALMIERGGTLEEYDRVESTLLAWHLYGVKAARVAWDNKGGGGDADPPAVSGSTKTAGSSTRKSAATARRSTTSSRAGTSSKRASKPRTTST